MTENRTLSDSGELALRQFQVLHLSLQRADRNTVTPNEALDVAEINDRFVLWASNIGLFNPAHSSLDYRLRDNEQICTFASNLLQNLVDTIQRS
jgi:hypothetical protein